MTRPLVIRDTADPIRRCPNCGVLDRLTKHGCPPDAKKVRDELVRDAPRVEGDR